MLYLKQLKRSAGRPVAKQKSTYFFHSLFKSNNMSDLLSQSIELPVSEYISLSNPIFKGQSEVDDNGMYWMVFENNGTLYKLHNKL